MGLVAVAQREPLGARARTDTARHPRLGAEQGAHRPLDDLLVVDDDHAHPAVAGYRLGQRGHAGQWAAVIDEFSGRLKQPGLVAHNPPNTPIRVGLRFLSST